MNSLPTPLGGPRPVLLTLTQADRPPLPEGTGSGASCMLAPQAPGDAQPREGLALEAAARAAGGSRRTSVGSSDHPLPPAPEPVTPVLWPTSGQPLSCVKFAAWIDHEVGQAIVEPALAQRAMDTVVATATDLQEPEVVRAIALKHGQRLVAAHAHLQTVFAAAIGHLPAEVVAMAGLNRESK